MQYYSVMPSDWDYTHNDKIKGVKSTRLLRPLPSQRSGRTLWKFVSIHYHQI